METFVPVLSPVIYQFISEHTQAKITLKVSPENKKLEYGEAELAFSATPKPTSQDYIVKNCMELEFGLYASKRYIENHGLPDVNSDLKGHTFIGSYVQSIQQSPFMAWLKQHIPQDNIRLRMNKYSETEKLIQKGVGVGMLMRYTTGKYDTLAEPGPFQPNWTRTILSVITTANITMQFVLIHLWR